MTNRTVSFLIAASCLIGTPSFAADHSMEDQIACTPDVYRLCSQYIPNENTIVACLQKNLATLSPDCRKVFTRPPEKDQDQDTD